MLPQLVIVIAGAALIAAACWAWAGRSAAARWWVDTGSTRRLMLGVVPGLGVLVLCGGMLALTEKHFRSVFDTLALVVALPMLAAVVLEVVSMLGLLPRWWGPKWYRDAVKGEGREPFDNW